MVKIACRLAWVWNVLGDQPLPVTVGRFLYGFNWDQPLPVTVGRFLYGFHCPRQTHFKHKQHHSMDEENKRKQAEHHHLAPSAS